MADQKIYPFGGMDGSRVLSAKRVKGGIRLREECDRYYSVVIDAKELDRFIGELRALMALPEPEGE